MSPRRCWLSLLALLLLMNGCALVPTGGPVREGRPIQQDNPPAEPYVRVIPKEPQPGWAPEQSVKYFLAASGNFENDHEIARKYLLPGERSAWKPSSGVKVYAGDSNFSLAVEKVSQQSAVVKLKARHVASISERGQYMAEPADSSLTAVFRLRKVGNEWRIVSHPSGLLLTQRDVERAYRRLNLYFFEPELETLVPNSIFLPAGKRDELPTKLARSLLQGSTSWLAPAVKSGFPEGTKLTGDIRVRSDTATVPLGGAVSNAAPHELRSMAAQLVWTLSQLRDVETVRLTVDGEAAAIPNAGRTVSTEEASALDPSGTSGTMRGYVVQDKTLHTIGDDGLQPAPGPAGSADVKVANPAVSIDAKHAAWTSQGGSEVLVGELREGGSYSVRMRGKSLGSPTWDRYGNLWLLERRADHTRVWMLADGSQPMRVDVAGMPQGARISALRVARGGTRVALITRRDDATQVMLGRIERASGSARIAELTRVPTQLGQLADIVWAGPDRLAVLGKDPQGARVPYLMNVDGMNGQVVGGAGEAVALAAGPHVALLVERGGREVWQHQDTLQWRQLAQASQPTYPG